MTLSIVKFLVSKINTFANFQRREINDLGNHTSFWFAADIDRYVFDFDTLLVKQGWAQYDTIQDAPYFGVWINLAAQSTLTYAEGDIILTECPTQSQFATHMQRMAEFYGAQPPAATTFHLDGTRTEFYNNRPNINETFPLEDVYTRTWGDALLNLVFPAPTHIQKLARFNFPIILTAKVRSLYVEWNDSDSAKQVYQNENDRWLSLLESLYCTALNHKNCIGALPLSFTLTVIPRNGTSTQPLEVTLLSHCNFDDQGEPIITIMYDALDD